MVSPEDRLPMPVSGRYTREVEGSIPPGSNAVSANRVFGPLRGIRRPSRDLATGLERYLVSARRRESVLARHSLSPKRRFPRESGIPGEHAPIIERALFEAVRVRLDEQRRGKRRSRTSRLGIEPRWPRGRGW